MLFHHRLKDNVRAQKTTASLRVVCRTRLRQRHSERYQHVSQGFWSSLYRQSSLVRSGARQMALPSSEVETAADATGLITAGKVKTKLGRQKRA